MIPCRMTLAPLVVANPIAAVTGHKPVSNPSSLDFIENLVHLLQGSTDDTGCLTDSFASPILGADETSFIELVGPEDIAHFVT